MVITTGSYWHLVGRGLGQCQISQCTAQPAVMKNFQQEMSVASRSRDPRLCQTYPSGIIIILTSNTMEELDPIGNSASIYSHNISYLLFFLLSLDTGLESHPNGHVRMCECATIFKSLLPTDERLGGFPFVRRKGDDSFSELLNKSAVRLTGLQPTVNRYTPSRSEWSPKPLDTSLPGSSSSSSPLRALQ